MKYEKLFSPLTIKGCTFPNRILRTAMVSRLAAEDGSVSNAIKERYRREAMGGPGAIIVEAAVVLPSRSSYNLRISDDSFIPQLREVANVIRAENPEVKVGIQVMHFLKLSRSGWRQKVEDFKPEELKIIVTQHVDAAKRAVAAGFDFIELHMAHAFTLSSFLSLVNKRTDEYGGRSLEDRLRLPTEVYQAVRNEVGKGFPLGIRINGEDFTIEGTTSQQSTRIAKRFAELGADYINVSAGDRFEDAPTPVPGMPPFPSGGYSGSRMSPKWWAPDGANVHLAERIRKFVRDAGFNVPIVTAGKIRTPELAEEILQQGKADIIGLCRPLLCDPDWPIKAKEGRADDIVRCCACGWCNEADGRYETVKCILWQKENEHAPRPFLLAPPCKGACPAGIDVQDYIELVTQGFYKDALKLIEKRVPLPAVISRVCPRPCETKCNRKEIDEPIAINALKRFVVEEVEKRWGKEEVTPVPRTKREKVAIIGSGPAGLTAAYDLVWNGYGVTILEALPTPGGMLAVGIPEYRLPKKVLQTEIEDIKKLGVEIKLNSPVGKNDLTLDKLGKKGYKAIFIAVGAHKSLKLDVPGEDMQGVYHGIAFLHDVNTGKKVKVGKRVAIIGGGNVAVDAARTALRLGAKEVFIVYRRSKQEMPAHDDEIKAAEEEGVKIHYLASPVKILGKGGKVVGMECIRMELGEPDASGRRRPIPIKGTEFVIDADMVIPAIGEAPDLDFLHDSLKTPEGTLKVDPDNLTTGVPGVFAGGDAVTGPATVIQAIAAGHKAAAFIDRYLRGESLEYKKESPRIIGIEDVKIEDVRKQSRESMPTLPLNERVAGFKEVELGFTEGTALAEANRCLNCAQRPRFPESKASS